MIHYITCHFGTDELIDIQLKHIHNHTTGDYKVWMSYTTPSAHEADKYSRGNRPTWFNPVIIDNHEPIMGRNKAKCHHFEFIPITPVPLSNMFELSDFSRHRYVASLNHQNNLHILTERVLSDPYTNDTDTIIWMDNDTLLVDSVDQLVDVENFIAAQRCHRQHANGTDSLHPHPLFASCKVGFWRSHNINWRGGGFYKTSNNNKYKFNDTGGYLYAYFEHNNIPWDKIYKSGSIHDTSQEFFEIYGNSILHLGSISLANTRRKCHDIYQRQSHIDMLSQVVTGKYINYKL